MLRQFIQRHLPSAFRRGTPTPARGVDAAEEKVGGPPSSALHALRPTDWLIGASIATLAVAFVAGMLGLRSSTADLQDQSRNNTRDLMALKADTTERINGIADNLVKTNQTLTDLLALRGETAARTAAGRAAEGRSAESRTIDTKPDGAGAKDAAPRARTAIAAPLRPPGQPAARAGGEAKPVRLGQITVPRQPERAREPQSRRPTPPVRPAAAPRPEPRGEKDMLRARREAILRQQRLRRLARRGIGSQPL